MESALYNPDTAEKCIANEQFEFGYYAELSKHVKEKGTNTLKQRIKDIVVRLGFTEYAFINAQMIDNRQTALNTYPDELVQTYYDQDLSDHDMIAKCALNNTSPFLSSTIHEYLINAPFNSDMTRCMKRILELNKDYGFYEAYHIPISLMLDECPTVFLFTVTIRGTPPIDFVEKLPNACTSLELLAEAIGYTVTTFAPDLLPKTKRYSNTLVNPKPLRALDTLANNDMTIEQIADKLCVSDVTINNHLRTVRKALKVKTNYAAIKRSIQLGLIKYDSAPGIWD